MKTPNAIIVCNQFFTLSANCKHCPIKSECETNPKDPDHPIDWEERIEQAATEYLKGNEEK